MNSDLGIRSGGWDLGRYLYSVFCIILFIIFCAQAQAAWVWDMVPAIPAYDDSWVVFKEKWAQRLDAKKIDEIIEFLETIEKKHPDKIEPKIFLGKAFFYKAQYKKKNNLDLYKKVEALALAAHEIDKESVYAFKILLDVLPYIGDLDYALKHHGEWIRAAAPLESGHVIPPMTGNAEWEAALALYDKRAGEGFDAISAEGLESVKRFNAIADKNPGDVYALSWACRVNYDIGQYYSSLGLHEKKGIDYYNKSVFYGEKALSINPHSLPAGYWTVISRARIIQKEPLFIKIKIVPYIMDKGLKGLCENQLYNYFGPSLALSTIITNGGWVAEKAIGVAGVHVEVLIRQLELAQIVYPTKLYALYGLADLYANMGKKEEALKTLDILFSKNPDADPFMVLENRSVVRFSRELKENIEKS